MKINILITNTLFLLLIAVSSCNKDIDWDAEEIDSKLVVEGVLTNELKQHTVRLSKTMDYNATSIEGVMNATISISGGNSTFNLKEVGNGYYKTDSLQGELGIEYTLNIELAEEIGGTKYYEATNKMKGEFSIDTAMCFINEYLEDDDETKTNVILAIFGNESNTEDDYYMYNLKRMDTVEDYDLSNNDFFGDYGDNGMTDIALFYIFDDSIAAGTNLTLEIHSISEDFVDYIREVNMEIDRYDPFGMLGPAANPKGNISGGALGFFRASAVNSYAPILVEPQIEVN